KVSCGWPGGGSIHKRIGECWEFGKGGGKERFEIFISPRLDRAGGESGVLSVLAHEMIHAVVGMKSKHGKPFKQCMADIGLEGRATSSTANEELQKTFSELVSKLGPYPHRKLEPVKAEVKQSCRQLKVSCPSCDYIARVARVHLEEKGAPICPVCGVPFEEETKGKEEGGDGE
ncbi:MAG TPA: SprT-like domain-containing protein, partial [Patescibacteria group bacterium]|nr:SprT-like domain-containing protein [Patescibacteria group bacterium]